MQGVAKALDAELINIGHAAVREIVAKANDQGVSAKALPYIFWALATKSGLPRLNKQQQTAFDLMVTLMARSGTMPNYSSTFAIPDDLTIDAAVDAVARHMGAWAMRTMYPSLLQGYQAALTSQTRAVPKATDGRVRAEVAFDFLRTAFRQVLDISSRKFRDGELLRRVVRVLPI